jgi:hypothetical protein
VHNRILVASLAATACTAPVRAQDTTATFDITSWTMPTGFVTLPGGSDHFVFRRVDPANWLLFEVYAGRRSSDELQTAFTRDWNDVNRESKANAPGSVARKVGADIDAREGGVFIPKEGYVHLIDVDAGGKVVTIVIMTGNVKGMTTYRPTIDSLLASVVVKRGESTSPAVASGMPEPPAAPVSSKTQVAAADLVGVWDNGSSTGVTYEQLAGGKYAGAWTHFFATEYTLEPNGQFGARFWATRPPSNWTYGGRWGLEDGLFVLRASGPEEKYRIVKFETAADGSTTMKLVRPDVVVTEYTGGEIWVRRAPK